MNYTNDRYVDMYERIVVIAVYIPNVVAIPFEENSEILLEQYREFLLKSSYIMQQKKCCRELIIHNNYIYGIFGSDTPEEEKVSGDTFKQITDVLQKLEGCMEEFFGKLYFGVGVAEGCAVCFSQVGFRRDGPNTVWMGGVLEEAFMLAKMAFCDGRKKVWVAKNLLYSFL